MYLVQQIDSTALLCLSSASGIQGFHQHFLKLLGKYVTSRGFGIENLGAGIPAFREGVLMDADEQWIMGLVDNADPILQIGYLFLSDGLPPCVYRGIGCSDHDGIEAKKVKKVIQSKSNLQIIATLIQTGTGDSASVLSAVAGIDDDSAVALHWLCFSNGHNGLISEKGSKENQGENQKIKGKNWDCLCDFLHGQHLD